MKIVADENIPLVSHYFGAAHELILKPGRAITRHDLLDADALLVRSVTHVNKDLLEGTNIKFVGSATTGADHLDTKWLDQANISYAIAKGCNARAVVEYVISVVAALQTQGYLSQPQLRAGVIGVGTIGSQVVEKLKILGFEVITCDPIRALTEKDLHSTPLEQSSDLDLISLHMPLTTEGEYPTSHLINSEFLRRQKSGCILLNTGRGATINFSDLKQDGKQLHWCFDVWENEPNIDLEVLKPALIATPHIAGYSIQSKYRGVEMLYQAALKQNLIPAVSSIPYPTHTVSFDNESVTWRDVVLKIFDPLAMTAMVKTALLKQQDSFDTLRKNFKDRHEFEFVKIKDIRLNEADRMLLQKLTSS